MALLKFADGKTVQVSADTGRKIWDILQGNAEPDNDRELQVAEKVSKIYLNYHIAPDDYIKAHFATIAPQVIGQWMVAAEPAGSYNQHKVAVAVPTRPDPTNVANLAFSKRWGLYDGRRATELARRYM